MSSSGNIDHKHQHINMVSSGSTDYGHWQCLWWQHGPQTPVWPPVATWTTEVFWEAPIQKINHSPSQTSCCCLKPGWSCGTFRVRACVSSRLPHTILTALVLPLSTMYQFCHLFHLPIIHLLIQAPLQIAVCHTVFCCCCFCSNSFASNTYCN